MELLLFGLGIVFVVLLTLRKRMIPLRGCEQLLREMCALGGYTAT